MIPLCTVCVPSTGTLLLLCNRAAIEGIILKKDLMSIESLQPHISDEVLDASTPLEELQPYFTKYAWAALEKKGKQTSYKQTYTE